jgi:hypothetical protein
MFVALCDRYGEARRDLDAHHAILPTMLANILKEPGQRVFKLTDFMFTVTEVQRAEDSWKQGLAIMNALAAAGGQHD